MSPAKSIRKPPLAVIWRGAEGETACATFDDATEIHATVGGALQVQKGNSILAVFGPGSWMVAGPFDEISRHIDLTDVTPVTEGEPA